MKLACIIPARSGSKGIPLKNIKPLNGKPLLAYTIEYALKSTGIHRTVVSTDSPEIAKIAEHLGAECPFLRPENISGDYARDYSFMRHALDFFDSVDEVYDGLVLLRPTSPFRPFGLIEQSIELLNTFPECTSVRSVVKSDTHPYRQWISDGQYIRGAVSEVSESYNIPRQELPESFFQSGDIEVVRRKTLLSGSVSGDRVVPLLINPGQMLDIDNVEDFENARRRQHDA